MAKIDVNDNDDNGVKNDGCGEGKSTYNDIEIDCDSGNNKDSNSGKAMLIMMKNKKCYSRRPCKAKFKKNKKYSKAPVSQLVNEVVNTRIKLHSTTKDL